MSGMHVHLYLKRMFTCRVTLVDLLFLTETENLNWLVLCLGVLAVQDQASMASMLNWTVSEN